MLFQIKRIHKNLYQLSDELMNAARTKDIIYIVDSFKKSGHDIRIVGGAVRDIIKSVPPKDFDFATDALPEKIKEICNKNNIHCIETGLKHGTLTAVLNRINYEITTLRCDIQTDGRHALVEFITDFKLDAERRDLTVNSMSLTICGKLYDYFNGFEDLINGKIRFVNDPKIRIIEDYLRILRYFRFYSKICNIPPNKNSFEPFVLEIIEILSPNLENIAVERIWCELSQILTSKFGNNLIKIMNKLKILKHCRLDYFTDEQINLFSDAHNRSINRELNEDIFKINASALLASFYDNIVICQDMCKRLKLSRYETEICIFIIKYRKNHDKLISSEDLLKYYKSILIKNYRVDHIDLLKKLIVQLMLYDGCCNNDIIKLILWDIPQIPINGRDIKKFVNGPDIANVLNILKDQWIATDYTASKEDLIKYYHKHLV